MTPTIVRLKLRDAARAISVNCAFICGGRGSGSYTRTQTGPRGSVEWSRPAAAPSDTRKDRIDSFSGGEHGND